MKLNQKGMSLVGVMVAVAIMGGLSLAAMRLMELLTNGNRSATQNFNITSSAQEMRVLLTKVQTCTKSLKNYVVTSESDFILYNQLEQAKFKPGTLVTKNIQIDRLYVKRPDVLTQPYRGPLEVYVIFKKLGKKPTATKRILKVIANVSGGKISDCLSYETQAIETSVTRSCEHTGGVMNNSGNCEYPNIKDGSFKSAVQVVSLQQTCVYMGGTVSGDNCILNQFNSAMTGLVQKSACEMLGGNLIGSKCRGIDKNLIDN
jgi:type II secretory pathway pseudopilin PulG